MKTNKESTKVFIKKSRTNQNTALTFVAHDNYVERQILYATKSEFTEYLLLIFIKPQLDLNIRFVSNLIFFL